MTLIFTIYKKNNSGGVHVPTTRGEDQQEEEVGLGIATREYEETSFGQWPLEKHSPSHHVLFCFDHKGMGRAGG
jgi:hypothetical protein